MDSLEVQPLDGFLLHIQSVGDADEGATLRSSLLSDHGFPVDLEVFVTSSFLELLQKLTSKQRTGGRVLRWVFEVSLVVELMTQPRLRWNVLAVRTQTHSVCTPRTSSCFSERKFRTTFYEGCAPAVVTEPVTGALLDFVEVTFGSASEHMRVPCTDGCTDEAQETPTLVVLTPFTSECISQLVTCWNIERLYSLLLSDFLPFCKCYLESRKRWPVGLWNSSFQQIQVGQRLTYLLQNSIGAVSVESTLLEDKRYSSRSDWLPVPLSVGSPESSSVEVGFLKLTNLGNFPLS